VSEFFFFFKVNIINDLNVLLDKFK
jgi:hypothetical protein